MKYKLNFSRQPFVLFCLHFGPLFPLCFTELYVLDIYENQSLLLLVRESKPDLENRVCAFEYGHNHN